MEEVKLLEKYQELIQGSDDDEMLVSLAFEGLKDLTDYLPQDSNVLGDIFSAANREIKKAIYMKRNELPGYLRDQVQSAEIDERTLENPWEFVCFYESLASIIDLYEKRTKDDKR